MQEDYLVSWNKGPLHLAVKIKHAQKMPGCKESFRNNIRMLVSEGTSCMCLQTCALCWCKSLPGSGFKLQNKSEDVTFRQFVGSTRVYITRFLKSQFTWLRTAMGVQLLWCRVQWALCTCLGSTDTSWRAWVWKCIWWALWLCLGLIGLNDGCCCGPPDWWLHFTEIQFSNRKLASSLWHSLHNGAEH